MNLLAAILLQSTSTSSGASVGSYTLTAVGLLLTSGAVTWFFRSGIDVIRAKDKAEEGHSLATRTSERVIALETRMERRDADYQATLQQVTAISERLETISNAHNTELRTLETQFSRVEGILTEIRRGLANLDQVGQMVESVRNTKEQLQKVQQLLEQNHVPRREMEARFTAMDQKIEKINKI